MKLLQQILVEAGVSPDRAFTVVPGFGGYFKCIRRVEEYSPEYIVLALKGGRLKIAGNSLLIDKYFQQDLFIKGAITGVTLE